MQAEIVAIFIENSTVCMAARVKEDWGDVEYIGRVPIDETWNRKNETERFASLIDAVKNERERTIDQKSMNDRIFSTVPRVITIQ